MIKEVGCEMEKQRLSSPSVSEYLLKLKTQVRKRKQASTVDYLTSL